MSLCSPLPMCQLSSSQTRARTILLTCMMQAVQFIQAYHVRLLFCSERKIKQSKGKSQQLSLQWQFILTIFVLPLHRKDQDVFSKYLLYLSWCPIHLHEGPFVYFSSLLFLRFNNQVPQINFLISFKKSRYKTSSNNNICFGVSKMLGYSGVLF